MARDEEFPPYDGSMDIAVWKAQRTKALKASRARGSRMLSHVDEAGRPRYVLTSGGNLRRTDPLPASTRAEVIRRDGHACVWCGDSGPFEVDHIIRYVDGGTNDAENLQTLCEPCHRSKGGQ